MNCISIKEEIRNLGYKVVFVPHSVVTDHIAVYNVIYKGRRFRAPNRDQQRRRGERLEVPLGQIWISKKYRKAADRILFHELNELKYQRKGYGIKKAHEMAKGDDKNFTKE